MARRRIITSALCLWLAFAGTALGEEATPGARKGGPIQPWTVDDVLLAEEIDEMLLSEDGSIAVWTREQWQAEGDGDDAEKKRVAHVFMARLDEADSASGPIEPVQLTRGAGAATGLALSPDARHLAFLSKREQPGKKKLEGRQVWVLPLGGGEAWPLTAEKGGVESVHWIDEKKLLVQRAEDPSAYALRREAMKDTSIAVEDPRENPPVRLFLVDLQGESKRLTANDDWIEAVSVAPDGRHAVLTAGRSLSFQFDAKVPPRTYLLDLESLLDAASPDDRSDARRQILQDSNLLPQSFQWSADSKSFYFIDYRANETIYRNAVVAEIHRFELETGRSTKLDIDWPRGVGGGGFSLVKDGLVALLADGTRYRPALVAPASPAAEHSELSGEHAAHLDELVGARGGHRLLYVSSSGDRPPQLYAATLEGGEIANPRQLGVLNADLAKRPAGRTEIVRWTGAEGDEVEGVLSYPFDYEEGERYALVLDIHGGPTGYDRNSWEADWASPTPLWRQRGAFVFRVNYHGSGNYGLEWAESIKERYYELEIPDIESGVDRLIERGLVDAERLAATGWSNGGILSAGLITSTDRYKAAIIGAADVEWISDWANVDFGASFDNYYFGGPPWERLDHYIEKSPFFKLPEVTTPSLVHTGTEDRNVPPHQSWSIYRVMQQASEADVRLLLYPGEPHGLKKLEHQRRKVEEDLAWLDRHLFGTHEEETYTVPEDSRLAAALLKAQAARQPEGLGRLVEGHLVPEGVPHAGLVVSRFETTRAQFSAYLEATGSRAPRPAPGEADLPVVGVGFDKALSYAAWLAELTGEPWRLPTAAEAERLAGQNGHGGNTLDRWLGYAANPDDAEKARARAREAGVELLEAVGSHAGARSPGRDDGPAVFDLDGNAAEWAVREDGTGQAVGPSAERPAKSAEAPEPAYIGFRVVRDLNPR